MDWIFLSPHFDDVVFSCGGLIWELTSMDITVQIWTVATGDPGGIAHSDYTRTLHERWDTGVDAPNVRLEEDRSASGILKASNRYLGFLDCIYRRSPSDGSVLYPDVATLFCGLNPEEDHLVDELASTFNQDLPQGIQLVSPLGIGNHADHVLTRKASERLNRDLLYYADFPYLNYYPEDVRELVDSGWRQDHFRVSAKGLSAWKQASSAYKSQISTFWIDSDHLHDELENYWSHLRGAVLYRQPSRV